MKMLIIFSTATLATQAWAFALKGFPQNGVKAVELHETIHRISESGTDYLVLFTHHAALYRFPKTSSSRAEVFDTLQSAQSQKTKLLVLVNPQTAEIISLASEK